MARLPNMARERSRVARTIVRFAPILLTLLAAAASGAAARVERRPAVILVLLDAARADRFSAYGYPRDTTPNIDRLAARGAVFLRHHAHGPNTVTSLPTLLTSRYFATPLFPHIAGVPISHPRDLFLAPDAESISLPRAFAAAGYQTVAVSAHTWTRAGTAFAAEFDELRDVPALVRYDLRRGYPRAETTVNQAIDWIVAHRGQPFFMYLHLMDTHFPHMFDEDAQTLFGARTYDARAFDQDGRPRLTSRALAGADRRYLDALYDGALRYADRHIGRLVTFLADSGLLDATLVAITSDHGEQLLEVPNRFKHPVGPLYETLLHVPFVVAGPGVPVARVDTFSEAVDAMPTLLDAAGVPLPEGRHADGQSLLPVLRGKRPGARRTFSAFHVASQTHRLLFSDPRPLLEDDDERSAVALYDLASDPWQLHDVADRRPDVVAQLVDAYRERLGGAWKRFQTAVRPGPVEFPFTIAAADIDTRPTIPTLASEATLGDVMTAPARGGWARSTHLWRYGLLARPGADPLRIEFPVPDGEYVVSIALRGAARVQPMGGRPHTARGRRVGRTNPWIAEPIELGPVNVRGRRFRARIVPAEPGEWLVVKHVTFRPRSTPAPSEAPEVLERLRALGYVQ